MRRGTLTRSCALLSTLLGSLLLLTSIVGAHAVAGKGEIRGDPDAVSRANALLEQVGGRSRWAGARSFYAKEHAYLRSGEVATVEVWRDFEMITRRFTLHSPSRRIEEVTGVSSGWEQRDGKIRVWSEAELAEETQGLVQEPYFVYHRLAKGDQALRVALEGTNKLNVYDAAGKLLCWFVLDDQNNPMSWGNFYKGAINQHWYGPLHRVGPVRLPKWGSAADGRWRFEYVDASLGKSELILPPIPTD
jgi:hypothetical protein